MNQDYWGGFVVGAALVIITMSLTLTNFGLIPMYRNLKEECEKNLPRNQVCVMKLVPQGE